MAYDKGQADQEFTRWSNSYDRSILQWLLFGPSHRVLIRRIREVAGDRPLKMLDVGCGTGVFASRVREALPRVQVCGVDLVSEMLKKGTPRWRLDLRTSSLCAETASGCRSSRGRSTSLPAPTASITTRGRSAPLPKCDACCGPAGD